MAVDAAGFVPLRIRPAILWQVWDDLAGVAHWNCYHHDGIGGCPGSNDSSGIHARFPYPYGIGWMRLMTSCSRIPLMLPPDG